MNINKLLNATLSSESKNKKVDGESSYINRDTSDNINRPASSSSYNTDEADLADRAQLKEKLERIKDGPLDSGAKEVIEDHSEDLKTFTNTSNWGTANRLAESQWAIKAFNKYHEGKARIEVWLSDLHLRSHYKATDEVNGKVICEKLPSEPSYIKSDADRQAYNHSFRSAIGSSELVTNDSLKKYNPDDAPLAHDLKVPSHYSTNIARPDATTSQISLAEENISLSTSSAPKDKRGDNNQDNDPSNSGFGGTGTGFGGSGTGFGGSGSGGGGQSSYKTYLDTFVVTLATIIEAISDAIQMII